MNKIIKEVENSTKIKNWIELYKELVKQRKTRGGCDPLCLLIELKTGDPEDVPYANEFTQIPCRERHNSVFAKDGVSNNISENGKNHLALKDSVTIEQINILIEVVLIILINTFIQNAGIKLKEAINHVDRMLNIEDQLNLIIRTDRRI